MGCGRSRRGMIENNESPANPRSVPPELEAVLRRKGYILLVKGDAGTGKTNLALELMALLHSEGDAVHISTRTYPEKLSFQHALFSKLAAEPNVQFFSTLEFDPTQFVVGHKVISGLHDLLSSMENPLVVLDSWEGISDYIPSEARMKVEQSLMAVLEETGARLILVSEHSEANTTLDQLADAILILRQKVIDDRRLRELEIRKLRGVPIRQDQYLFTLAGGRFQYLEPFDFKLPAETAMFRPVDNTETHMSTGSRDLDSLLGGGVARGSTVLLEMRGDVPFEAQLYVPLTALLNFLATNNAVMMFPYSDFDPKRSRLFATQFLAEDMYDANMRVFTTDRVEDPVAIKFSLDMAKDFEMWLEVYGKFKNQGKIIWKLMALDTVENFQSVLARPNLELTEKVANISQIHLVITTRWGTLVFYGVKPRTGFYGLQFSFGNGYPEFKLIPLQDVPLSKASGAAAEEPPVSVPVHIRRRAPQTDFFETVARSMQSAKKRLIA